MVNLIFILVITAQIEPEVPNCTVISTFCEQLKRDATELYEFKENLAAVKEEAETYLTPILYYVSVHHKQPQMHNAVSETTQHNYKKDFKSLE